MTKSYEKAEGRIDSEKEEREERKGEGLFCGLKLLFPSREVRREVKRHLLRSEVEMIKAFRSIVDAGIDYLERKEKDLQEQSGKVEKIDIE